MVLLFNLKLHVGPLTSGIPSNSHQNSAVTLLFVKEKPDIAEYDFNKARDFKEKVTSNFRYLIYFLLTGIGCFVCAACDSVPWSLNEHISSCSCKMFPEKHIAAQPEQRSKKTAESLSLRPAGGKFVLPVQTCRGDCTGRKLLQEMSAIPQPRYEMR